MKRVYGWEAFGDAAEGDLHVCDDRKSRDDALSRWVAEGGEAEPCELWELPEAGMQRGDRFGDYVFRADNGRLYADAAVTAAYRLEKRKPDAETAPALLQMEEYRIANVAAPDGTVWLLIERQLAELAERVARAYGCEAVWLDERER